MSRSANLSAAPEVTGRHAADPGVRETPGRLWPTVLACTAVLLAWVAATAALTRGFEHWTFESWRRHQAAHGRLGAHDVSVLAADGSERSLWPVQGPAQPVMLVDFVYTRCNSVCQSLGSAFAQMQAELQTDAQPHLQADSQVDRPADATGRAAPREAPASTGVRLLSLSFDAANDRPGDLAAYAQRHHADARWWTVAVPASVDAAAELLERLRVVAIADGAGGYVHNGAIHLVDGRGTVRGIYDENQWREALHDARVLVRGVRP